MLAWLDSGADIPDDNIPILRKRSLLPASCHQPVVGLLSHLYVISPPHDTKASGSSLPKPKQRASQLHFDYGRSLHADLMACDPFYALGELFRFVATSHWDFLNIIDHKLDKWTSLPQEDYFRSLSSLKYTKNLLY